MGTNIDDLINDMNTNRLSNEENSMVDSIINELNNESTNMGRDSNYPPPQAPPPPQGQNMPPQLSPEEKQMLLKQQQHQQRMIYEQQQEQQRLHNLKMMQQQREQQQQQQQQQQQDKKDELEKKLNEMKKDIEQKTKIFANPKLNQLYNNLKTTFVVFMLVVFFNVNSIDEFLRFKKFSLFYNIQNEKSTILFVLFKAMIITGFYYMITKFI